MRALPIFIFCFVWLSASAIPDYGILGGQLKWKHYGTGQGLPSSETYQVFQDSKGYIWIATDRGVARYDGFGFKTYDQRSGLIDQVIFKFVEDAHGNIWFVSFSGELCYWNGSRIVEYKYNHLIKKYLGDFQSSYKDLVIRNDGSIYFALTSRGSIIISSKGKLKNYHKSVIRDNTIFYKFIDKELFVSNLGDESKYSLVKKPVYFISNKRKWLLFYTKGNIRLSHSTFGNENYLLADHLVVDLKNPQRKVYNESLIGLNVDKQFIWLCLFTKGAKCYKKADFGIVERYKEYLSDYSVSSVLRDRQGGYWFSTLENGIFYAPNIRVNNWSKADGMPLSEIYSITGKKHELVVGTKKGYTIFQARQKNFYPVNHYFTPNSIYSNKGKLHASGFSNGIYSKFGVYNFSEPKKFFFDVHALAKVKDGVVSVSGPVIKFESDDSDRVDTIFRIPVTRGFNFIHAIEQVNSKLYYLGAASGLRKLRNGKIERLKNKDSRFNIRVDDIKFLPNTGLFVATRGAGLLLVQNDIIVKSFDKKNGLCDDHLTDMCVDNEGVIYVSSYKGVSRIRKLKSGNWEVKSVNEKLGMISNECLSVFADESFVWCGTKKGLVMIPKACFDLKTPVNGLLLEGVYNGGKKMNVDKKIVIQEGIPVLEIKLRNTNYNLGTNPMFRYRFSKNQKWILSASQKLILQYPSSGIYNLEVEQLNVFGNWTPPKKLLLITIEAPFYKRWYFFMLIAGIAVWLIYLSFRARLRSVNKKYALQKQVNELEQKALSAQMNPHFIFNSLNSIQSFLLYEENDKAERYLLKFSKLIRSILSSSRETFISLDREIELLTNYIELEQMRFQSKFDYRIENEHIKGADHLMIPPMMIQPIVENAILHGLSKRNVGGILIVRFELRSEVLIVIVEDNGIGIQEKDSHESKGHRSFGTQITRERMEIYEKNFNQRFSWNVEKLTEDAEFPGTRVTLTIPVQKKTE